MPVLSVVLAQPARATLVVLTDGTAWKVKSYKAVDAGTMRLSIDGVAAVFVPMRLIDRVIDDDVPSPELEAAMAKVVYERKTVVPLHSWRYSPARGPLFPSRFDAMIIGAARRFDVDAALVSAIIKAESDFNPREVSHKGARGLMQLMPSTAERFGVADSFDPLANINGGTRYLGWLLETFHGNADLAIAAYNAGEGNVQKYKGIPPFRETMIYVNRVAGHLMRGMNRTAPRLR